MLTVHHPVEFDGPAGMKLPAVLAIWFEPDQDGPGVDRICEVKVKVAGQVMTLPCDLADEELVEACEDYLRGVREEAAQDRAARIIDDMQAFIEAQHYRSAA